MSKAAIGLLAWLIVAAAHLAGAPAVAQTPAVPAAGAAAQPAGETSPATAEKETDEEVYTRFVANYDGFNSGLALGFARYRDHIQDVKLGNTPLTEDLNPRTNGMAFALDFLVILFDGPLWVGTSLALASGTDDTTSVYGDKNLLTHGALSAQVRYNFYGWSFWNNYLFLALERGRFSQSFMVPYNGAPLRLSAAGTSWSGILGVQRANGGFVTVVYHRYEADRFDVKEPGTTTELPVSGRVQGQGIQVLLGYRWF